MFRTLFSRSQTVRYKDQPPPSPSPKSPWRKGQQQQPREEEEEERYQQQLPNSSSSILSTLRRSSTNTLHRHSFSTPSGTRNLSRAGKKVVLYTTSLRTIRRTYEDCRAVMSILKGLRVAVDERDLSMNCSYRRELQGLLGGGRQMALPRVFIGRTCLGGVEEIRQLHEDGELEKLFECEGVAAEEPGFICHTCGSIRFLPCSNCSGSKRLFDEEEDQLVRCFFCNENGLVRCPNCCWPTQINY